MLEKIAFKHTLNVDFLIQLLLMRGYKNNLGY